MKKILSFLLLIVLFLSCNNNLIKELESSSPEKEKRDFFTGTNLALNAGNVYTDSNYNSSFTGNNAKDGNGGTKWCSTGYSSSHWLKYDLGSVKAITGFVVKHAGSNGENRAFNTQVFDVRFGNGMDAWSSSTRVTNYSQNNTSSRAVSIQARYVMLDISDCGIDNYARIYEFEVWGSTPPVDSCAACILGNRQDILDHYANNGWDIDPSNWGNIIANWCQIDPSGCAVEKERCASSCGEQNYALSATASTDSSYSSAYNGDKARDGNNTTKWCSAGSSPPHWLKYDLGEEKTINRIVVRHAGANGEQAAMNTTAFKIQFGRQDNSWENEVSESNSSQANITDKTVGPFQARYVRLYITDPGIDNYARIYEFEVWSGGPVTTPVPTNPPVTPTPPPSSINIKGAYWLQFDGGYDSYENNASPIAWNLDYCVMIPELVAGYKNVYKTHNIKTLARIILNLSSSDKYYLENSADPAAYLGDRIADWNSQVQSVTNALGADFNELIYSFVFGNEENLDLESGISGRAYARAYNIFKTYGNTYGKPLHAAGPGGCALGMSINCTSFYNGMLQELGAVDGFAIHAYGDSTFVYNSDTGGFANQVNAINNYYPGSPVFITEYNPGGNIVPMDSTYWTNYFNGRYRDVVNFNATGIYRNQIKALMYFVDSNDHWLRWGCETGEDTQWLSFSLRNDCLVHDGRRNAWKNAN